MVEYVYIIKITVCTNAYLILFPVPFFIFTVLILSFISFISGITFIVFLLCFFKVKLPLNLVLLCTLEQRNSIIKCQIKFW